MVPRERIHRLALQIAATAGPAVRGERWLSAVPQILAAAVRGFAAAASHGGIDLDLSRPPAPSAVHASVPPSALAAALLGRLGMPQGIEIKVGGHPGWTVEQKAGSQVVKHDGMLETFNDAATGIRIPAIVQHDGQIVDVAYARDRQIRTRSTVAAFSGQAPACRERAMVR
jgi:hypothetical protein